MYQSTVRIRLRGKGEFLVSKTPTSSEPTSPQPRCYTEHTKLKASRKNYRIWLRRGRPSRQFVELLFGELRLIKPRAAAATTQLVRGGRH